MAAYFAADDKDVGFRHLTLVALTAVVGYNQAVVRGLSPSVGVLVMLNPDETAKSAQPPTRIRQPRFRRWASRRARQLAIVVLALAGTLVVGACGVVLRRTTCLIGLPDVGDPFDVAAFRAFQVPEDQDAFALFREAAAKLRPMPDLPKAAKRAGPTVAWSQADSQLRQWLEASREALGLFRQGAMRADGMASTLRDPFQFSLHDLKLGAFVWLALLDASRLEEQGDTTAAWAGYRAIFHMRDHIMRRGTVFDRYVADHFCRGLEPRIASWAANRNTDVPLIRRALDDVRADEPQPDWDAFSLKLDYLQMMSMLDRPDGWAQQGTDEDQSIRIGGEPLPPNLVWSVNAARRYLINEPERSRRVLRLAFANWLAHVQERDQARCKPAVRASFLLHTRPTHLSFYAPGPSAPVAASALSPQELPRWLITTRDAKVLLFQWPWPTIRSSEKRQYRALVVLLAEELYHRERGSRPPSEEALVGPYLDHLPDDGSSELDDGTALRVDDSDDSALGKLE
jgi:hypothetical protein